MFKTLRKDYERCSRNKKAIFVLTIYRLGNKIFYSDYNMIIKKCFLVMLKIIKILFIDLLFGIEIPFEAKIGAGLRLVHLNGIVINKNVVIGENCTIFHQVTIGSNEHKNSYRKAPRIGDNCYIGAGAKIIGDITIGAYSKIGANATVTKNIKDNSTIIGTNIILDVKSERKDII